MEQIEQIEQSYKKSKNIIWIIQSCLILILIVLIIFIMVNISRLQGTARVINYAGLVRGATQREVKLEITGNQNDELIKYLDDIIDDLKYKDGQYNLVNLRDNEYHDKLQILSDYWEELKKEIKAVREVGYQNTDIVKMSEIYFKMADETVSAAESYSERIAIKIRTLELLSVFDMLGLVILIIIQTLAAMKMSVLNKLLEQRAYTDAHTGLPNKDACEVFLKNKETVAKHTACIMFDLNNLLRRVIPQEAFVGRYGGDEFMVVIYNTSKTEIEDILMQLSREKDSLNSRGNDMPIDYACGWAISDADSECTIQMLLDKADYYMYENKQSRKKSKQSLK